jgi:DHA3 family macrolide efflux protein-like MFS transporter
MMSAWLLLSLAYLVAGPLADLAFKPLLSVGGPLAGTVGHIIGVGPGRGIALLFIVFGIITVLITLAGYLYPRLRLVESELPDRIADESPDMTDDESKSFEPQKPSYQH